MDTQTRRALKQDKFKDTAQSGLDWLKENRTRTIRASIAIAVVVVVIAAGLIIHHRRSTAAQAAFGQAMNLYNEPVAAPGQPAAPGEATFATAADRAQAANQKFTAVADKYGSVKAGKNALYFAGITAIEMGRNGAAETDLKKVADSGDKDLAALGKLALAGLYRQTNRAPEAVKLYKQLIANPTATVPANAAQLELAALYETTNPAAANQIYAQLKSDKGAAGQIAAQKLGSK